MNTRTIILLLIIIWLLSRRRLAKTSQAANQSNISAPEQKPATPNSKFEPLFYFTIPEAEIKKQQEKEAKTNKSGGTSIKRSKKIAKFEPVGYGYLYNGAVLRVSNKSINPKFTKIPTKEDFETLINYLGGLDDSELQNKLNQLGFYIQRGGRRSESGVFENLTFDQFLWSSTISNSSDNYAINLFSSGTNWLFTASIRIGYSVRVMLYNTAIWTPGMTISDLDGNLYGTVKIGSQVWLTANLKVSKFNDGSEIEYHGNLSDWGNAMAPVPTPRYCYYNNDLANAGKTSQLY